MKSTIRFSAKFLDNRILLPKNISAVLPSQSIINIEGIINSYAFRAHIETNSKRDHCIKITTTIQKTTGIDEEKPVLVEITRIADESETRVPADLRKALATVPRAQALWNVITPLARRDWIFWMISGKKEETRTIRIKKMLDMLASGKRRVCCFAGIQWL